MPSVIVEIARPPDEVWRAFTDARQFAAWMPGLREATVIADGPDGLPREVHFELSTALSYSLVYTYDAARREVHWAPHDHVRDAVRGHARVEARDGGGSRLVYKLEQGAGRTMGDLVLGGAHSFVAAFVRWVEQR